MGFLHGGGFLGVRVWTWEEGGGGGVARVGDWVAI